MSSFITYCLLAKPFIQAVQGCQARLPPARWLPAACPLNAAGREEFVRVTCTEDGVRPLANQSSGALSSLMLADGIIRLPAQHHCAPGSGWNFGPLMSYWRHDGPIAGSIWPRRNLPAAVSDGSLRLSLPLLHGRRDDLLPRSKVLTLEELLQVGAAFVALGVNKIRLTGGEPLVRNNLVWLVQELARLPGLNTLALTTNASQLEKLAQPLKAAGLSHVNISLDSLDPVRFKTLTRTGELAQVLKGIEAAQAAGFARIKLNSVMLRSHNLQDLVPLVEFALARGLDISFIEEMPWGRKPCAPGGVCQQP